MDPKLNLKGDIVRDDVEVSGVNETSGVAARACAREMKWWRHMSPPCIWRTTVNMFKYEMFHLTLYYCTAYEYES